MTSYYSVAGHKNKIGSDSRMKKLILFAFVGVAGFIVDALVLYLLKDFLGLYIARLISFLAAVFATWLLNRKLTFRSMSSSLNKKREFLNYLFFMLFGGVVNYIAYSIAVYNSSWIAQYPVVAVAIGSLCGLAVNFTTSSLFVFKNRREQS